MGVHSVQFTITDEVGNKTYCDMTLTVRDVTPPIILVEGESPASVNCGTIYVDAGATDRKSVV